MTKTNFKFAALALAAPGLALAMPAQAAAPASAYHGVYAPTYEVESANQWRDRDRYSDRDYRDYRRSDRGRYDRHDRRDRYERDARVWRGRDGRTYCQRDDGTTGLLLNDDRSSSDLRPGDDISNSDLDQVAATKLAVDR